MEFIDIVEKLGVPVTVAGASMWFIWKQTQLDLVNKRKDSAYERMVERARSVH